MTNFQLTATWKWSRPVALQVSLIISTFRKKLYRNSHQKEMMNQKLICLVGCGQPFPVTLKFLETFQCAFF